MTSTDEVTLAAKLGTNLNSAHGHIYFAPEAANAYAALGLSPHQQYFASRGAALGAVGPEVVVATFFNFNPAIVHRALPSAWRVATPSQIQQARIDAAAQVMEQCAGSLEATVAEATDLAGQMLEGLTDEGRPLAAANRSVPEPDEPWARLWQRLTILREWRGDAHVAALVTAPVDAVEALVLHAATGIVPKAGLMSTRQWPEEAWQSAIERLVARGLVEADGSFTAEGKTFRAKIEATTNEACVRMVDALGAANTVRFNELLQGYREALVEGGAFASLLGGR